MSNEYTTLYINNLLQSKAFESLTKNDLKIMFVLMNKAKLISKDNLFGGNVSAVGTKFKKEYCKSQGITEQTFEKSISHLKKAQLIRAIEGYRGLYMLNPFYISLGKKDELLAFRKKCVARGWFTDPHAKKKSKLPSREDLENLEDTVTDEVISELEDEEDRLEIKMRGSISSFFD